jgi:hypothetical protein
MKIYEVLFESQQKAYHLTDIFSSRIDVYGAKTIRNLKLTELIISSGKLSNEEKFTLKMWADAQIKVFDDMIALNNKLLTITSYENANNIESQLLNVRTEIETIRKNLNK